MGVALLIADVAAAVTFLSNIFFTIFGFLITNVEIIAISISG